MHQASPHKKILIISTGGTITVKHTDTAWQPGELTVAEILEHVPDIAKLADLETITLFNTDSSNMRPDHWQIIAREIYNRRHGFSGVVIIHGTDTMQYTAAALSFMLQHLPFPVVLTGSQIPFGKPNSRAGLNIYDAVYVASQTSLGEVVVVIDGYIHRGTLVRKIEVAGPEMFQSVGVSPIGVTNPIVRLQEYYRPAGSPDELVLQEQLEEHVLLLPITPNLKPDTLQAIIDAGCKGLLLEGYGPGNVPIGEHSLLPFITECTNKHIPIVLCTQCDISYKHEHHYQCGIKAIEAGAIPGFTMLSETALIKLMWAMANTPQVQWSETVQSSLVLEHVPERK